MTTPAPKSARSLPELMADCTHVYIGRKKSCNCIVAVVIDEPHFQKDTQKSVREFLSAGYVVERITNDEWDVARPGFGCKCAVLAAKEAR